MSDVLKPTGNVGDFVHNSQNMASDDGYNCVSKLWYEQTTSLDAGIDQLHDQRRQREDIDCAIKHMRFGLNNDDQLILEHVDGREFAFTDHAIKQAANWCDKLSHSFIKRLTAPAVAQNGKVAYERDHGDAELLLHAFKNGMRRIDADKVFKFRTYSDGTLRAWLSDRYAPIDNIWYLEQIQALMPNARLSHWKGDADTIYGNILIPDTVRERDDSDYGGMISPGNCEIGRRRFEQYPSVFRAICMNGCIWDQAKGNIISKVHRGDIDLNDLRLKLVENINKQIPLMGTAVDNFLAIRSHEVKKSDNLAAVFGVICKENGFSKKQSTAVVEEFVKHESEQRNLFGIVNAITRAGQRKEMANEDWLNFDLVGGQLMSYNDNKWERTRAKANAWTKDEIEKTFGAAV